MNEDLHETIVDVKSGHPPYVEKIRNLLWAVIQNSLFRYSPFFCYGWRRFLLRCFGAELHKSVNICRRVRMIYPWGLHAKENVTICNDCWLICSGGIYLEKNAQICEYAKIITGSHDSSSSGFVGVAKRITLEENSWVGTAAILVSGGKKLTIGRGAIVGAGSVVMRNVKPMTIVVGNPAKFLMDREFTRE